MNAELLYTSAPQGLKQGSRGFCTVLSTVGMPLNIATKLESLSGYRHLHPSGTPDAAKNPVNHSHLKLTVGGRTLSVISRISDYGLDYSQRTNKLAHHVVVDSPMPACGPAALLGDPSVIRSEWDGNCVNIPAPPAFPALSIEPAVCQAWESIAGDAGWAGVVANAWSNNASKPIFLIFSEDQSPEILPLIAEAIAILPPSKRWQATFGTYVTNLPPDVDCKVRCVVAGSDEARMASARGVVIDLTQPCGPAPSSEAATAARDGTFVGARSNVPPPHGSLEVGEEQPPAIGDTIEDSEPTDFDPERPFGTQSAGPPPTIYPGTARIAPRHQAVIKPRKRSVTIKGITVIAIGIAVCSLVGLAYFLYQNPFLKSLRAVATESIAKKREEKQLESAVPKGTEPPAIAPSGTDSPEPNPKETPPQPSDEPKKRALNYDEIVIRLHNPDYKLATPIAICGESIQSAIDSTKPTLTDEESKYLAEVRANSKFQWIAIGKDSEQPINLAATDSLIVPINSEECQLFLEVTYGGETWKSIYVPVIQQAQEKDFELSLTAFTTNNENIPFGLPESRITQELKVRSTNAGSLEYLNYLASNATVSWYTSASETPLSDKKEYEIERSINLNSVHAITKMNNERISIKSESLPVITRLTGKFEIDSSDRKENRIVIHIEKPIGIPKQYKIKLKNHRLNDDFMVDDLISENDKSVGANEIRLIQGNLPRAIQYSGKLKTEFISLVRELRESKDVKINKRFIDLFDELGDKSLSSIGEAFSSNQIDNLIESLRNINELIFIAFDKKTDYKVAIKNRCAIKDNSKPNAKKEAEEREVHELAFVEWYNSKYTSLRNDLAKKSFSNDPSELLGTLNQVAESMRVLKKPITLVVDHPKSEFLDSEDRSVGEFLIPIELTWRFPTKSKRTGGETPSPANPNADTKKDAPELEIKSTNAKFR